MLRRLIAMYRSSHNDELERQINEELRFHRDSLTETYIDCGLSEEEARSAATRRFGDLERIQAECLRIRRRRPFGVRLLQSFLLLLFAAGAGLRVIDLSVPFNHLGDVSMMTGVLGLLLIHVKGLKPKVLSTKPGDLFLPRLGTISTIQAFDELGRTPVERLMADKPQKDS